MLTGEFPLAGVRAATSWLVEGHHYAPSYKRGLWDGRKHLFNSKTGSFPTGLLGIVQSVLTDGSIDCNITDHRCDPYSGTSKVSKASCSLKGVAFTGKYSYQFDAIKSMVSKKQGIVKVATNGGKSEIACGVTKVLSSTTLFIVNSRELLYQARERFSIRLGIPLSDIGIIGDGHWSPNSFVTIASLDTLESRIDTPECQEFLSSIEVLFVDECHHVGSETWYTVATLCPAYYRFGLSGTPIDRTDGANLRLLAATGDIIFDIGNKQLVDLGVSARADIIFDKVSSPILETNIRYPTAYKLGVVENDELRSKIIEWTSVCVQEGLSVLILVEDIKHGKSIDGALWTQVEGQFIPHQFIWGEENTVTRREALKEFGERKLPVLIASTILDEGVDVPTIDVIICAGSKKSKIRTLQRLGRGLRGDKLIVIEFSSFCHDYLREHALKRYLDYKNEGCFPIHSSSPSRDKIRELWDAQG